MSLLGKYVIFATQLSHFINWPISVRLNEEHFTFTFHLQYKHCGTFANRKYEELSYPQKSGNVRPHPGNSIENTTSRENATPSSGTSPLASHKEVAPPDFLLSIPLLTLLELPLPVPLPSPYSPSLSPLVIQASSMSFSQPPGGEHGRGLS